MSLADNSIKRPVTTIMLVFIVLILGFVSLTRLDIDLLPSIEFPIAVVSTGYEGAGPKEVESIVTKNIENIMATVSNVKSLRSISSEGSSLCILEFNYGTDMNFATLEMREKLDIIKGMFPDGVNNPMVMKLDPNMMPIMNFAVSQQGKEMSQVRLWAEDVLKPRLERIDGVASVSIYGGQQEEIKVIVDPKKLSAYGLSMSQIVNALRMENINMPGGIITEGNYDMLVRATGEFKSLDDIRNLPIMDQKGGTFLLGDLANVQEGATNGKQYSKVNGHDSLSISLQKESNANTVRVAQKVNKELKNINEFYKDINITTIIDQSEFINKSIINVAKNALIGGALAILILFIFLKNFKPTLVIAVSIPISIIATFILVYFAKITLNVVSLGGLALGIGMLVDNSIVVLENIYRMREEGLDGIQAASRGTNQVSMAITASTLTTICVFLPIVFVQGITAQIFKELALTVTFSLVSSLVVALTLVPLLSIKLVSKSGFEKKNKTIDTLNRKYQSALSWAIFHRKIVVLITIIVFAGSIIMLPFMGREFFPTSDQGQIDVSIKMPKGTRYDETIKAVQQVENKVADIKESETVYANIGGDMTYSMAGGGGNSDSGSVTVALKPIKQRSRTASEIGESLRSKLSDIPDCDIQVNTDGSFMGGVTGGIGAPIAIQIKGDNLDFLKKIAGDITEIVSGIPGTAEVRSSFLEGMPELKITLDRQKAVQYGINVAMISSAVKNYIQGSVATRYRVEGREIDVRVQSPYNESVPASEVGNMLILSPMGINIPLNSIAILQYDRGPVRIERMDQSRVVTVNSSLNGRSLGDVTKDIEDKLNKYPLPEGYSIEYTGEVKQLSEAFNDLWLALILGIVLVYMVMASQFESLIHPFTIMFTVPLAFTGAIIALFLRRTSLSVPAYLGFIILTGIVVNNGIVLVDYINILRREGMDRNDAVIKAGPTRLRPILMTTLTTILGLVPLALGIGEGIEIQVPMAVSVIGGLTLSTALTLIIVPVIYTLFDDLANKFRRKHA